MDYTDISVKKLVEYSLSGEIVLPDFQRSFIWGPEKIRELIVSILSGYYIGSMLVLQDIYKEESHFALRLIEGTNKVDNRAKIQSVIKLILDGQQRTTALFYALFEPDIPLKNRKSPYKFFVDLEGTLKGDIDNSVYGISLNDRKRLTKTQNKEMVVTFSELRDIEKITNKFKDHKDFGKIIILANKFLDYKIITVVLDRTTSLETLVETFERINRTGEPLSVFELLTARLYKYDIKLRDLLESAIGSTEGIELIKPEWILKVIALNRGLIPKRKEILELDHKDFEKDWNIAINGLDSAYKRITDIRDGYGVFDIKKWMPYSTTIVPLASMINFLKLTDVESPKNYNKIDKWYWNTVFQNRYDQAVDSASESDYKLIKKWFFDDNAIPEFIRKFESRNIDLDISQQANATYKGVINLITLKGAIDFQSGNPPQFEIKKIQDDHIFPKSIFSENRIINRTLLTTNTRKSYKRPSEYFKKRINDYGEQKLKEILKSHVIPENSIFQLLNDNIEDFLEIRRKLLIEEIINKISV